MQSPPSFGIFSLILSFSFKSRCIYFNIVFKLLSSWKRPIMVGRARVFVCVLSCWLLWLVWNVILRRVYSPMLESYPHKHIEIGNFEKKKRERSGHAHMQSTSRTRIIFTTDIKCMCWVCVRKCVFRLKSLCDRWWLYCCIGNFIGEHSDSEHSFSACKHKCTLTHSLANIVKWIHIRWECECTHFLPWVLSA